MKKLILLGASDQARVVFNALRDRTNLVGFIDIFNNKDFPEIEYGGYKLIGDLKDLKKLIAEKDYEGIVCFGDNNIRKKIFEAYHGKLGMINVVHDTSVLQSNLQIGLGNYIGPGVIINNDTFIGDNNIINTRVTIEHDCKIGSHINIAPGAVVSGNVKIGDSTFVGAGAVIIDDIQIGDNVIVGAGAVVVKDVPSNSTVVGVPARAVKRVGL